MANMHLCPLLGRYPANPQNLVRVDPGLEWKTCHQVRGPALTLYVVEDVG